MPCRSSDYEAGRLSVMQELTAAVARFNEDDSLGIGDLILVIQPWLDPPVSAAHKEASAMSKKALSERE